MVNTEGWKAKGKAMNTNTGKSPQDGCRTIPPWTIPPRTIPPYIHTYIHACIYMYMYVCICMCVCMCVYVCVYVCMYVYVCVCIHVYVCMHNILGAELSGGNVLPKMGGGIVRG